MIPDALPSLTTSSGSSSPDAQVLEERPHGLDVLLRARHQPQQRFASVLADPLLQDGFPPLARPQPLGVAVHEQIDDGVFGQVTLAEVFVLGPKLRIFFTHRRPRQKLSARIVGERVLDVARRQAARKA